MSRVSTSRRSPRTPRAARGWWQNPRASAGGPLCWRTKRSALRAFLDENQAVIDSWGGFDRGTAARRRARQQGCREFDPVNARFGFRGRDRVCLLDDAIWHALREGKARNWCLDKIDLDMLNEVGRLIHGGKGQKLRLPGAVEEALASRRWEAEAGDASRDLDCGDGSREGVRACRAGSRAFRLHEGRDDKPAKRRRGEKLHADYACDRDEAGRFVKCDPREDAPF